MIGRLIGTSRGPATRFRVTTAAGSVAVTIPTDDTHHLAHLFARHLGDRYREPDRAAWSGADIGVVAVTLFFAVGAIASTVTSFLEYTTALVYFILAAVLTLAVLLACRPDLPARPVARRRSARPPEGDPVFGVVVKLAGIGWILGLCVILSQLEDPAPGPRQRALPNWVYQAAILPGLMVFLLGVRIGQRTFHPYRHPDYRRPVLYLRPFSDDDVTTTLQPDGLTAYFYGVYGMPGDSASRPFARMMWSFNMIRLARKLFNVDRFTVEETWAAAFRSVGPLVTVGRPGDWLPIAGADRMYIDDDNWQEVVETYLTKSAAVVIQPANTDGVRWEVETAFRQVDRRKLLFSLMHFVGRPQDYEEFCEYAEAAGGVHFPRDVPFRGEPVLVYFDPAGLAQVQQICYRFPYLWPLTGNAIDIDRTTAGFRNGLLGKGSSDPLCPRWHPLSAPLSVMLLFAAAVLLVVADLRKPKRPERVSPEEYRGRFENPRPDGR